MCSYFIYGIVVSSRDKVSGCLLCRGWKDDKGTWGVVSGFGGQVREESALWGVGLINRSLFQIRLRAEFYIFLLAHLNHIVDSLPKLLLVPQIAHIFHVVGNK